MSILEQYTLARREWNERYGSHIVRARQWRRAAFAALAAAAASTGGLVALATQSRIVPYVVEVDGQQRPLHVYRADELRAGSHLVRAELAAFVGELRAVSSDAEVQRAAVERVYAHLSQGEPATEAISGWYRSHNPFDRAARETVVVEVNQVLQLSGESWRIEWTERPRSRTGQPGGAVRWTATAQVATGDVPEDRLILNPVGLIVREFDWSRDLLESGA